MLTKNFIFLINPPNAAHKHPQSIHNQNPCKNLSHLLEMGCSWQFCFNCPPPANNTDPPFKPTLPANDHSTDTLPAQVDYKDGNSEYEWDSDFLLLGIACICVAFLIIVSIYYMYARWHANRLRQREVEHRGLQRLRILRSRGFSMRSSEDRILASPREGLRRSMMDALPVFVYQPENFTDGLRCAVCLCEFQGKEKAKLLPSCKHSFHVDCIDMWFYSHSTCPLCRARVDAQPVDVEMRVIEEEDEKVFMSSTSGCETKEERMEKKSGDCCEGEEESGGHAVIDMPATEN